MFSTQTILCPTDFSDSSRFAFRLAGMLAQEPGSHVVVLHVKQTFWPTVAYGSALAQLEPVGHQDKLWEVLRHFEVPNPKVRVEHRLVEGEPAREILRMAREIDCDLIVMGSHGRTGLPKLLLGSVAEQVFRKAPCPVVAVKTGDFLKSLTHPEARALATGGS